MTVERLGVCQRVVHSVIAEVAKRGEVDMDEPILAAVVDLGSREASRLVFGVRTSEDSPDKERACLEERDRR